MVQVSDASTATGEWSATRLVRVLPEEFDMAFETWVVAHEDLQHVRRVRSSWMPWSRGWPTTQG